jgi:hypothetical protein
MAAFLTSHPNIAIPPVGSNMWTYFHRRFGPLDHDDNLDRCLHAMLRYEHVRVLAPDTNRIRREFVQGPRTYARLFGLLLQSYAARQGKPRWGEQTGLVERFADEIFDTFPAARIVHMVRDPRDRYAASLEQWPDGRGRAGGATARWLLSTGLAERHSRRYPGRYLVIRYEDLVADPRSVLQTVCAFVDEQFHPDMLWMPAVPDRRDRLVARSSRVLTDSPLSPEYIGMYRAVVPRHEVAFIQHSARRPMRALSYEPDDVHLAGSALLRYAIADWPNQQLRRIAWRTHEWLSQRLPTRVGRRPDARTIVGAERTAA